MTISISLGVLILACCVSLATGMFLGVVTWKVVSINYKQRWESATRLLNMDPERAELLKAEGEVAAKERATYEHDMAKIQQAKKLEAQRRFASLSPTVRMKMEKDRMNNGYQPNDPLTDLPPETYRLMVKNRMRHGFQPPSGP